MVKDEKPLDSLSDKWGIGFIKQDTLVQFIYGSVKK
jgi:hypothetical protein